jgi:short-subunit dehydrogenase involved in D-alanine esterification of teichoic acids
MQSELHGQTVIIIGGTSGIGLETARRARAEGAQVILTARHPERLEQVAREIDALRSVAFDANDFAQFLALISTNAVVSSAQPSRSGVSSKRLMWPRSPFTS